MQGEAIEHLEAFLAEKPTDEHAKDHVAHAEATLSKLRGEGAGVGVGDGDGEAAPDEAE